MFKSTLDIETENFKAKFFLDNANGPHVRMTGKGGEVVATEWIGDGRDQLRRGYVRFGKETIVAYEDLMENVEITYRIFENGMAEKLEIRTEDALRHLNLAVYWPYDYQVSNDNGINLYRFGIPVFCVLPCKIIDDSGCELMFRIDIIDQGMATLDGAKIFRTIFGYIIEEDEFNHIKYPVIMRED